MRFVSWFFSLIGRAWQMGSGSARGIEAREGEDVVL